MGSKQNTVERKRPSKGFVKCNVLINLWLCLRGDSSLSVGIPKFSPTKIDGSRNYLMFYCSTVKSPLKISTIQELLLCFVISYLNSLKNLFFVAFLFINQPVMSSFSFLQFRSGPKGEMIVLGIILSRASLTLITQHCTRHNLIPTLW